MAAQNTPYPPHKRSRRRFSRLDFFYFPVSFYIFNSETQQNPKNNLALYEINATLNSLCGDCQRKRPKTNCVINIPCTLLSTREAAEPEFIGRRDMHPFVNSEVELYPTVTISWLHKKRNIRKNWETMLCKEMASLLHT